MTVKHIYGLYDPRNYEVFYVGQAKRPRERFIAHLTDARGLEKSLRIREIVDEGLLPQMAILESIDFEERGVWRCRSEEVKRMEMEWIRRWESRGHRLLNRDRGNPRKPFEKNPAYLSKPWGN